MNSTQPSNTIGASARRHRIVGGRRRQARQPSRWCWQPQHARRTLAIL